MKNALDRNKKLGTAEEKIGKLEDIVIETIQKKHAGKKRFFKKKRTSESYWDIIKWPNIWVTEVPKGER